MQKDTLSELQQLTKLQQLIAEIPRSKSSEEVINTTLQHLTSSAIFRFDYAIFYEIEYSDGLIRHKQSVYNTAIYNFPSDWIISTPIKFGSAIANSIFKDALVEIRNDGINLQANIRSQSAVIVGREDYARLLISLAPREMNGEEGAEADKPVALLEVGYAPNNIQPFKDDQKIALSIYADNLAHFYGLLLKRETDVHIQSILNICDRESGDDYLQYLGKILENICLQIKADYGGIALVSFNKKEVSQEDVRIEFHSGENLKNVAEKKQLLSCKSIDTGTTTFFNNLLYTEKGQSFHYSSLSVPITYNNRIIGSLEILRTKDNFFTPANIEFVERMLKPVGEKFATKKFHASVAELVSPDYIVHEHPAVNISPLIKVVQEYFFCDYVAVWVREYTNNQSEFRQQIASSSLLGETRGQKNVSMDALIPEFSVIDLNTPAPNSCNAPFWEFARDLDLHFFIHIPLRLSTGKYGFINIYSKRNLLYELSNEDRQFLELIADKTTSSFLTSKMIYAFSGISQSLVTNNFSTVLQEIADSARELLNSDPVLIFRYNQKNEILFNESIYSGLLYDMRITHGDNGKEFLDLIAGQETDRFYERMDDLPKEYKLRKVDNFWDREKIKSLAVVILRQHKDPVGIMLFNYRQQQQFSPYVQQLIRTFSALASTAINTMNNVAIIKEQRNKLQQEADKVSFEYEMIFDKMQQMLPVSRTNSLVEVIRAVNHDIRNHLLKIAQNLVDIKNNSGKHIEKATSMISGIENDIRNVSNLIYMFEPDSFKISFEYIDELLRKVVDLFGEWRTKNNPAIIFDIKKSDDGMPGIRCSRSELAMVFYNLISNSVKAIAEKWGRKEASNHFSEGLIRIDSSFDTTTRYHVIRVEDNGTGMDKELLSSIYEPGFTTSRTGLGIGLYFIKNTVSDVYNGSITCESYKNKGTTFEIKIRDRID